MGDAGSAALILHLVLPRTRTLKLVIPNSYAEGGRERDRTMRLHRHGRREDPRCLRWGYPEGFHAAPSAS